MVVIGARYVALLLYFLHIGDDAQDPLAALPIEGDYDRAIPIRDNAVWHWKLIGFFDQ
jgi:hypothetical protein